MSDDISTRNSEGDAVAWAAYRRLEASCGDYLEPKSIPVIQKAFVFANSQHAGQLRKSGEPYILHPLAVAEILAEYHMDEISLTAAILHDVVEDTHVSVEEVEKEFGHPVASLVEGLTKISKIHFRTSQHNVAENFRKMVLAMSKDIRVIVVKLADRTHNMRTIRALPIEKRQRIAEETLEIYTPLAGRLGMYRIKAELEDLCLREMKPDVYQSLAAKVAQKKIEREKVVGIAEHHLDEKLKAAGIEAKVYGRAKHFYSIYKKMSDKKIEFEDIYDLFALRVLVSTVSACYEALGVIHNEYRPVPGRFKDFIAMPKGNMYQSLHTTVVAAHGELLEVQIRTYDMHDLAENGIACHWSYKETRGVKRRGPKVDFQKFHWLKQMVKHQKELSDSDEFMEAIKVDLFEEEVYVLSPQGDVFDLKKGATSLDFAFAVHTDLGLRVSGVKVNGRMGSLRTRLYSGDVVELLVGNKIRATKDWLNYTVTSKARNRIRAYLRTEEREQAKQTGQELLVDEFAKIPISWDKVQKSGVLNEVSKVMPVGGYDDLVMQLGYGKADAKTCVQKILTLAPTLVPNTTISAQPTGVASDFAALITSETPSRSVRAPKSRKKVNSEKEAVHVEGMAGILVRMARCCEPLPGQSIVGFISRSSGVTVHTAQCPWALSNDPARRVECSWVAEDVAPQGARLRITTHDKPGVLAEITRVVSAAQVNIAGVECFTNPNKRASILMRFELSSLQQLKDIIQKIESVEGVIHVERTTS